MQVCIHGLGENAGRDRPDSCGRFTDLRSIIRLLHTGSAGLDDEIGGLYSKYMFKGYRLTASTGLHKGDRDYQQDQVALLNHPRVNGCILGIVADGMGGRSGGRKASDQVMLTARQLFERYSPEVDDASSMLQQLAQEAHVVIKLTAISAEEEPHSTVAAFLINPGGDCHWAHAGDSRIYHFHGNKFVKRTLDHSYVQTLVNRGEITEDEANVHPQSNILMGCLGTDNDPIIDVHFIPKLRAGDVLMACSDGVWHYFNNSEIGSVLSTLTAREATEFLIEKARSRGQGGGDNLSLVIVKLEPLTA
jgi:PPM family protein phosphatase